jgi:hypothetical protein
MGRVDTLSKRNSLGDRKAAHWDRLGEQALAALQSDYMATSVYICRTLGTSLPRRFTVVLLDIVHAYSIYLSNSVCCVTAQKNGSTTTTGSD